jgi:hypothetical protein
VKLSTHLLFFDSIFVTIITFIFWLKIEITFKIQISHWFLNTDECSMRHVDSKIFNYLWFVFPHVRYWSFSFQFVSQKVLKYDFNCLFMRFKYQIIWNWFTNLVIYSTFAIEFNIEIWFGFYDLDPLSSYAIIWLSRNSAFNIFIVKNSNWFEIKLTNFSDSNKKLCEISR